MLALRFLRYWWLRPRVEDPALLGKPSSDDMKSQSMTSIMEPLSAPQFEVTQYWSKIPFGVLDSMQRSAVEIEKALMSGKNMILIEPSMASHVYTHYISNGWLLQENTVYYGSLGVLASYFFPRHWYLYVPCCLLAFMHSWVYFKVYKFDRLSQYQAYDDDRHPVSNLVTSWVLGQRPTHFQYILKKERVIVWEIISEVFMYSSMIMCLKSLETIEDEILAAGEKFTAMEGAPESLMSELLSLPAYSSGYFKPPELIRTSFGMPSPADIPSVTGWFDVPWFGFRWNPIKYDLALIICGLGGYFVYKLYNHIFEYDGEEVDAVGWEWNRSPKPNQPLPKKHPYWVEPKNTNEIEFDESRKGRMLKALQDQEEKALLRISRQIPYGYAFPGYPENHFGIYT